MKKKITKWEPEDFALEMTTHWSFPKRGDWATHDAKWRGNWSPYIPRNILLRYSQEGDLILYLADGRDFVEQTEVDFINTYREKMILVWNKTDAPDCRDIPPGWIGISTKTGNGVEALCEAVFEKLTGSRGENFDSGTKASVGSLRQKEAVERAATHSERAVGFFNQCLEFDVIAQEMQEALEALGEITGETVAEDILGDLFSRFCVGK